MAPDSSYPLFSIRRILGLTLCFCGRSDLIGHKIAADLQAAGIKGVITNSTYDTWWHGGFRTAPYFHNSIGILSEAASAKLMTPTTVTQEQLARSNARGMGNALEAVTNFPDPWLGGQWRPRDIMNMEMIRGPLVALNCCEVSIRLSQKLLRTRPQECNRDHSAKRTDCVFDPGWAGSRRSSGEIDWRPGRSGHRGSSAEF